MADNEFEVGDWVNVRKDVNRVWAGIGVIISIWKDVYGAPCASVHMTLLSGMSGSQGGFELKDLELVCRP